MARGLLMGRQVAWQEGVSVYWLADPAGRFSDSPQHVEEVQLAGCGRWHRVQDWTELILTLSPG